MKKNTIILYNSSAYTNNAPAAPAASQLEFGELVLNYNNTQPALFFKKANGSVSKINDSAHVTEEINSAVSVKYTKPSAGIPKTDLASGVQTSLNNADSAIQNVHTINRQAITGTGNTTLVSTVYINGTTKTPNSGTTNTGRVDLGSVAQSIYMNNSAYTPTTGTTNTGRVNIGSVCTSIYTNGTSYTPNTGTTNRGRVTLPDYYNKTEINNELQNIESTISSSVSSEATARENADNTKQDKLISTTGYSATGNRVLVSLNGTIQWTPFNNILAGSTTPISSEGNNGDLYIQTD